MYNLPECSLSFYEISWIYSVISYLFPIFLAIITFALYFYMFIFVQYSSNSRENQILFIIKALQSNFDYAIISFKAMEKSV